ncbi:MAG: HD domain-containing protein [Bacteroidota bacterium]
MIDIAIFAAFLAINLMVGLGYGARVRSLREYAIGSKNFSTATLTATLVATWFGGGSLVYGLEQTYTRGLYYILALIGAPTGLLLTGRAVGVRMHEFLNNLSVAEVMRDLYGKAVQVIAAISGILGSVGGIAIQFKVTAKMVAIFFALNGPEASLIAAGIVILYSAFGGIKSVTFTDVVQFVTFGTFIPILALTIWNKISDPHQVVATLTTNPTFSFKEVVGFTPGFMATLGLMCYFAVPGLSPSLFQRVAMASNISQVKRSFTYAAGFVVLIDIFKIWVGILLLTDSPGLSKDQVFLHLVTHYTYPGLKGFFAVGVIALAMSTADSLLNAAAVMFTNDVASPLKLSKYLPLTTARSASVLFGGGALLLAIYTHDLLSLVLLSGSFYMPIVTVPVLLAVFGFRSTKRTVLIGMAAGAMTLVLWSTFLGNASSIIPGMIANFTFLMGSHYLLGEPGGWQKKQKTATLVADTKLSYQRIWEGLAASVRKMKPLAYLEKNLPNKEYYYPLLAFYLLTATYASLYNLSDAAEKDYLIIYRTIQYSVLLITTSLLAFPIWPQPLKNRRLLALLWPLLIFYTLFLVGGMLVIMSSFQPAQVLIFMLNLVMTALLVYWQLALTLALSGFVGAMLLFKWTMGVDVLAHIATTISFKVSHGLLLFSSFLIALFRHQQAHTHLAARHQLLEKANQEAKSRLLKALRCREELLEELKPDEVALFNHTTAEYINHIIYRVRNYLRLEVGQISLNQLLAEVMATLKLQDLRPLPKIQQQTHHQVLQVDVARIKQLLVNSIYYVKGHAKHNRPLIVVLEDTTLGYKVSYMKNYIKKIDALKITITAGNQLPPTKELYKVMPDQPVIYLPQSEEDLGIEENARIIDAHYGYLETIQTATECTQIYVIPVMLREVRGQVMELLREPVALDPVQLKHPLAIQLEKELFDKLAGTDVDLGIIQKALNTIKKYHGGVTRKSGEPFFTHPMAVALILLEYTQDQAAVLAALLHDTVEDTSLTLAQLEATFGSSVAFLVRKATNLEDKVRRLNLADHENLQRLTHYEDIRVAFVKLSDRLHNMRTIGSMPPAKQQRIAQETISFFVPMAENLKLEAMTKELEALSLAVLSNTK